MHPIRYKHFKLSHVSKVNPIICRPLCSIRSTEASPFWKETQTADLLPACSCLSLCRRVGTLVRSDHDIQLGLFMNALCRLTDSLAINLP
jgi:hypothetical protein